MNITDQLLLSLLNLKEDDISNIASVNRDNLITYYVALNRPVIRKCPVCGKYSIESNGYYPKKVILTGKPFDTGTVVLKVPRYKCLNCHHSFSLDKHLAPKKSSVSYDVILKLMDLLKDPKMTFQQAAQLTGISPTTAVRIFDKYCHIQSPAFPEVLCIDEIYTKNSDFKAKYSCIFYDFYRYKIIDVLPSRQKDYLHHYFQPIQSSGKLLSVKYVCIDMHYTYKVIASIYFKKATICVDSFHVVQLLNNCLSDLRIRLMKTYPSSSIEYYLLKRWKNLLFKTEPLDPNIKKKYNKVIGKYMNYYDLLEMMLDISVELRKAHELWYKYICFNRESTHDQAKEKFDEIYKEFVYANINEFAPFITALANWKKEIINSFIVYKGRRINSSTAESMNAQIATLLYNTRGIRNSARRKKRIMYCINKEGFVLK